MYALKTIFHPFSRFLLTVFGIAFCSLLMFFLMAIYQGVSQGSVQYIRSNEADLWVLQQHTTNILRNTSILSTRVGYDLKRMEGIKSASPVIFMLASIDLPTGPASVYLAGYNEKMSIGAPPDIVSGRTITGKNQIILDKAFARKHNLEIGSMIQLMNESLEVVGLSDGTNMFVIQYAFINITTAYKLMGISNIVSCYLVLLEEGSDPIKTAEKIKGKIPGIAVYSKESFLNNNIREMESGVLGMLYAVALIGAIVLTVILSLILSVNVLENRKDYAILKAMGCPRYFIGKLVVKQAFLYSISGITMSVLLFLPLLELIKIISPEISGKTSITDILLISCCVILICLVSSVIPIQKIRNIYPLEIFK